MLDGDGEVGEVVREYGVGCREGRGGGLAGRNGA